MEEQFVPYEIALELKKLGFDEECFGYYNHKQELYITGEDTDLEHVIFKHSCKIIDKSFKLFPDDDVKREEYMLEKDMSNKYCSAPLWQQVYDWFELKHNMVIVLEPTTYGDVAPYIYNGHKEIIHNPWDNGNPGISYYTEDARLWIIKKAIELCKKN